MRTTSPDCAFTIDELDATLCREFPDPVDVFEDQLAHDFGLTRHPGLSLEEWRRVRFIDAADSHHVL